MLSTWSLEIELADKSEAKEWRPKWEGSTTRKYSLGVVPSVSINSSVFECGVG